MSGIKIIFSCRYMLAYLGLLCTCLVSLLKINLNIALVAMTENRTTEGAKEFDWSNSQKANLMGSYFYGYICTQILGAWLSSRYGFKWILMITILSTSLITIITPFIADSAKNPDNFWILIASRVFIGLGHGVVYPVLLGCWSLWGPPMERSQLISIYFSGNSLGTCLIYPLGGFLGGSDLGWRSIFYVTGGCGIIWCLLWLFMAFESPSKHPRISMEERKYIEYSIGEYQKTIVMPKTTPWFQILTSLTVWAVCMGQLGQLWTMNEMNALFPTYLNEILGFEIEENGLISATPSITMTLLTFVAGFLTDAIRSRHWLRTITIRKINNFLGLAVPGITIVLASYVGNTALAITLFNISLGMTAFAIPGCKASMMDFAPLYGGVIFAISNTVAGISGFLAPLITGALLGEDEESSTIQQWQMAFLVTALASVPGLIMFQFFGTDQIQEWAQVCPLLPKFEKSSKLKNEDSSLN